MVRVCCWIVCAAWLWSLALNSSLAADVVTLSPADDVASVVNRSPIGTQFYFEEGIYRADTLAPKHHQTFRCAPGAVFNGSDLLKREWQKDGDLWFYDGMAAPSEDRHGDMSATRQINQIREDLYIDDNPVLRVNNVKDLHANTVSFDDNVVFEGTFYQVADRIYLSFDPSKRKVEYSGRIDLAVRSLPDEGDFVRIENCVFEKYATKAQLGAIQAGFTRGWTLVNVTARLNHGAGLRIGENTRVEGGHYVRNGQLGIAGSSGSSSDGGRDTLASDLTVVDAEIAFNNWAGYWIAWEAGGIKILKASNVTLKRNHVHHNFGKGIWLDWYVEKFTLNNNHVHDNASIGIAIEVSFGGSVTGKDRGIISHNKVERNAVPLTGALDLVVDNTWWWGAQILLQNSQRIDVTGNELLVDNGQGIGIIDANDRGVSDPTNKVPRRSRDNRVYRNTIRFTDRERTQWYDGKTGIDSDDAAKASGFDAASGEANNRIYENSFIFSDPDWAHWRYDGKAYTYKNVPEPWEIGSQFNVTKTVN